MRKCGGWILGLLAGTVWAESAVSIHTQSPDGRYMATAITTDGGSAIVMRDLMYEKKSGGGALVIPVNKTPVVSITFSADGQHMITTELNGVQRVWQMDRGGAASLVSTTPDVHP